MSRQNMMLAVTILMAAALACAIGTPATPTVEPTATENEPATQAVRDTQTAKTEAAEAAASAAAQSTAEAAAAATATQAFSLTATPARATAAAANRQATRVAGTATTVALQTQAAQPMADRLQQLREEGYLAGTEGRFFIIPAFDESWAQLGWYRWWETDFTPKDFVIRAEASWESASDRADWWTSGCGFVFRAEDNDNHYLAHLGLDGWVYLSAFKRGNFVSLGGAYFDKVGTMQGNAELMLIAEGDKFSFFVNGDRVYSTFDRSFGEGVLALTLLSGTNKDFGTRCRMLNIELWELAPQ